VPRIDAVAFGSFNVIAPGFNLDTFPEMNLKVPFVTEAVSATSSIFVGSNTNSSNTKVEFGPIENTVWSRNSTCSDDLPSVEISSLR